MNTSRRIEDLAPVFQPIVREVIARCESRGIYPFIMEGRRSPAYQACLYARGRVPAGERGTFRGHVVVTSIDKRRGLVVASSGTASYSAPIKDWSKRVTDVLLSWHVVGLAVDFGFRSAAGANDAWNLELGAAKQWRKLEEIYAAIDAVWSEVAPERRWGNDWDQDGVPVGPDPDESLVDMPHWEWHPGRTLAQVADGNLPAGQAQCEICRNFRPVSIERDVVVCGRGFRQKVCPKCAAGPVPVEARCAGGRR